MRIKDQVTPGVVLLIIIIIIILYFWLKGIGIDLLAIFLGG